MWHNQRETSTNIRSFSICAYGLGPSVFVMFESPLKQHQNRWIDRFYVKMVYFFALAQKSIWSNSRWLLCLRGGEEVQIDHKPPVKQSRPLFPFCPLNSMHVYCFILWIFPFAHGEHPLVWMKTVQMKQRKKTDFGRKRSTSLNQNLSAEIFTQPKTFRTQFDFLFLLVERKWRNLLFPDS